MNYDTYQTYGGAHVHQPVATVGPIAPCHHHPGFIEHDHRRSRVCGVRPRTCGCIFVALALSILALGLGLGFGLKKVSSTSGVCTKNQCVTGQGICAPAGSLYTCTCYPGYSGKYCEQKGASASDQCAYNQCVSGQGTCTPEGSSYKCTCSPGFSGTYCEQKDIADCPTCSGVRCNDRGTCKTKTCDYACDCDPPFSGKNCEYVGCQPCAGVTCGGHGVCNPSACDYVCDCDADFFGKNCERDAKCTDGPDGNLKEDNDPFNHMDLSTSGSITGIELQIHEEKGHKSIAAMRVRYGSTWSAWEGEYKADDDKRTVETVNLQPGEIITKIGGWWGDDGALGGKDKITELSFTTNFGKYGPFGGMPKDKETFFTQSGSELLYLTGIHDKGIISLETVWGCP